jgi:hypothetical protein
MVALSLGAMVLGTATASVLRQQRTARHVGALGATESQLVAVSTLIPAELTGLAASAGDLVVSELRDTALQLRAPIVAGLACDSSASLVILSVSDADDDLARSGSGSVPHSGDSLWWYAGDSLSWLPRRITDAQSVNAPCRLMGKEPAAAIRLTLAGSDPIPAGAVIRVTRQLRYVFYRGGDGTWQFGLRDWNEAAQRFAAPQPLAGPFIRHSAPGERSGFRYFDASDAELVVGDTGVEAGRVMRIRITALAPSPWSGSTENVQRDSADVALERERAP